MSQGRLRATGHETTSMILSHLISPLLTYIDYAPLTYLAHHLSFFPYRTDFILARNPPTLLRAGNRLNFSKFLSFGSTTNLKYAINNDVVICHHLGFLSTKWYHTGYREIWQKARNPESQELHHPPHYPQCPPLHCHKPNFHTLYPCPYSPFGAADRPPFCGAPPQLFHLLQPRTIFLRWGLLLFPVPTRQREVPSRTGKLIVHLRIFVGAVAGHIHTMYIPPLPAESFGTIIRRSGGYIDAESSYIDCVGAGTGCVRSGKLGRGA
ncbi:hypothetical protein AX15_007932 [Amanita polypyramis BW_CC]|nr:hypothetical protein AX15_007932 [Amanita polypyramis BW_CC]